MSTNISSDIYSDVIFSLQRSSAESFTWQAWIWTHVARREKHSRFEFTGCSDCHANARSCLSYTRVYCTLPGAPELSMTLNPIHLAPIVPLIHGWNGTSSPLTLLITPMGAAHPSCLLLAGTSLKDKEALWAILKSISRFMETRTWVLERTGMGGIQEKRNARKHAFSLDHKCCLTLAKIY